MVRTIKLLQKLLILGGICLGVFSHAGGAQKSQYGGESQIALGPDDGGGSHPWPWGFEVTFPWNDVQGIWRVQKDGKTLYFSFRRVQAKRVKIKQIDFNTCNVIGTGQGLERDRTIVAQIRNTYSDETYNLTIYAFNEEDSPEPPILSQIGQDHVIVVRINSLDGPRAEFAAQMVRISDRLELKCGDQDKKTRF
jgi:hypothetical protein